MRSLADRGCRTLGTMRSEGTGARLASVFRRDMEEMHGAGRDLNCRERIEVLVRRG